MNEENTRQITEFAILPCVQFACVFCGHVITSTQNNLAKRVTSSRCMKCKGRYQIEWNTSVITMTDTKPVRRINKERKRDYNKAWNKEHPDRVKEYEKRRKAKVKSDPVLHARQLRWQREARARKRLADLNN